MKRQKSDEAALAPAGAPSSKLIQAATALVKAGLLEVHCDQILVDPFYRYDVVAMMNDAHAMTPDQIRVFQAMGATNSFIPVMRMERASGIVCRTNELKSLAQIPATDAEIGKLAKTHIIVPYIPRLTFRVLKERFNQRTVVMMTGEASAVALATVAGPPAGWYAVRAGRPICSGERYGSVEFSALEGQIQAPERPLPLLVLLLADLICRAQLGGTLLVNYNSWTSDHLRGKRISVYGGSVVGDPILSFSLGECSPSGGGLVNPAIRTGYRLGS